MDRIKSHQKNGISTKDYPSKTAPFYSEKQLASIIAIAKQHNSKQNEKKKERINVDDTSVFIQKLFPDKINFSINEAASVLNVSYDFVREHIISGSIKATKFGDRWMINLFELIRILTEGV